MSLGGGQKADVKMSEEEEALVAVYGEDPELLEAIRASMREEQLRAL